MLRALLTQASAGEREKRALGKFPLFPTDPRHRPSRHPSTTTTVETSYSVNDMVLKARHAVERAEEADRLHARGRHAECQELCYDILAAEPAEAIAGKCLMYLAEDRGVCEGDQARRQFAQLAVDTWQIVVERTGRSRFPLERAKGQLVAARVLNRRLQDEKGDEGAVAESGL